MKKQHPHKAPKAQKNHVQDLAPRKAAETKGGLLQNSFSNALKTIGESMSTMARKG